MTPPKTRRRVKLSEMVVIPEHDIKYRRVTKKEQDENGRWWGRVRFQNRSIHVVFSQSLDLWVAPSYATVYTPNREPYKIRYRY